jgi:hypothetical protein
MNIIKSCYIGYKNIKFSFFIPSRDYFSNSSLFLHDNNNFPLHLQVPRGANFLYFSAPSDTDSISVMASFHVIFLEEAVNKSLPPPSSAFANILFSIIDETRQAQIHENTTDGRAWGNFYYRHGG